MSQDMHPAVAKLLGEIAEAKIRAEQRKQPTGEYGILRGDKGKLLLKLPPAPVEPSKGDCCNSNCTPCILDSYRDRLHAHQEDVKALTEQFQQMTQRHEPSEPTVVIHRPALQGGLLDPLKFSQISVLHVHWLGAHGLMAVLDATALNFILAPGEHIHVRSPQRQTRPFTPVMIEAEDQVVRPHLFIKLYDPPHQISDFWRQLADSPGQKMLVRGPIETSINLNILSSSEQCVLVAGGSGIAPIFQILQFMQVNCQYHDKPVVLVQCARDKEDVWLTKEIQRLQKDLPSLATSVYVSSEKHWLSLNELRYCIDFKNRMNRAAVVCGPPIFNRDVVKWLQKLDLDPKCIQVLS